MIVPVFVCGQDLASFSGRPGWRRWSLKVPGGSRLLETRYNDRRRTLLFVPTSSPDVSLGWSALSAVRAARAGGSSFQLIEAPISRESR